jgi:predicted GTPase
MSRPTNHSPACRCKLCGGSAEVPVLKVRTFETVIGPQRELARLTKYERESRKLLRDIRIALKIDRPKDAACTIDRWIHDFEKEWPE